MDNKRRKHLQELLQKHRRRLHILEVQSAQSGYNTQPEVINEIEDIRDKIRSIEEELSNLDIRDEIHGVEKEAGIPGIDSGNATLDEYFVPSRQDKQRVWWISRDSVIIILGTAILGVAIWLGSRSTSPQGSKPPSILVSDSTTPTATQPISQTRDISISLTSTPSLDSVAPSLPQTTSALTSDKFLSVSDVIVFTSDRDGDNEVYTMNADGSNQKQITKNTDEDNLPRFSPDNKRIVFVSKRDGQYEIYLMDADGNNQKRLTTQGGDDPSWSPDGKKKSLLQIAKENGIFIR